MTPIEANRYLTGKLREHLGNDFHPETEAAVSHWLQASDPTASLPYLTDEMQKILTKEIGKTKIKWSSVRLAPPKKWKFTFIDLFAGIGGFRTAFQSAGGKCVFTSEWDKYAQKTYETFYGEKPYGDITLIPKDEIPDHDVLCAGFPCQPFSLAGVSKKNSMGRKHGFEDETQGTLFFHIEEILKIKQPKAFMLENVKNLRSHDKGNTLRIIEEHLKNLGYIFDYKIVDGGNWVPQHRERIFIVGYHPDMIDIVDKKDIIIPEAPPKSYKYRQLSSIIGKNVEGHTLGPGTWDTLKRHKAHHAAKGNGFGYGIHALPIPKDTVTRTISARYHKDGSEILIKQPRKRPRRLTVREAMQLQGFDPKRFYPFPVSNTQAYRQIGNSVVMPAIRSTAKKIAAMIGKRSIDTDNAKSS